MVALSPAVTVRVEKNIESPGTAKMMAAPAELMCQENAPSLYKAPIPRVSVMPPWKSAVNGAVPRMKPLVSLNSKPVTILATSGVTAVPSQMPAADIAAGGGGGGGGEEGRLHRCRRRSLPEVQ